MCGKNFKSKSIISVSNLKIEKEYIFFILYYFSNRSIFFFLKAYIILSLFFNIYSHSKISLMKYIFTGWQVFLDNRLRKFHINDFGCRDVAFYVLVWSSNSINADGIAEDCWSFLSSFIPKNNHKLYEDSWPEQKIRVDFLPSFQVSEFVWNKLKSFLMIK